MHGYVYELVIETFVRREGSIRFTGDKVFNQHTFGLLGGRRA
jgi:hypothetical protein